MPEQTVKGVYENGAVRLTGKPPKVEQAEVLVMFLDQQAPLDLASLGIEATQAAALRARLSTFAEDWERPEMDAYDAL